MFEAREKPVASSSYLVYGLRMHAWAYWCIMPSMVSVAVPGLMHANQQLHWTVPEGGAAGRALRVPCLCASVASKL